MIRFNSVSSTHPPYLAEYLKSDLFVTTPIVKNTQTHHLDLGNNVHFDMAGIPHPKIFLGVATFLLKTTMNEILHGIKPLLTKWKGKALIFKRMLFEELGRYVRRQFPFNQSLREGQATVMWWKDIANKGSEYTQVLPVCSCNLNLYCIS